MQKLRLTDIARKGSSGDFLGQLHKDAPEAKPQSLVGLLLVRAAYHIFVLGRCRGQSY